MWVALWGSAAWGAGEVDAWEASLKAPVVATGWAQRVHKQDGERVLALEGLGRQGEAQHIRLLVQSLAEPWPEGAAAGHALGEMGRRNIVGVEAAIPDLAKTLSRVDPRTRRAAAYAIRRIGLNEATGPWLDELHESWSHQADPQTRAWLVEALGTLKNHEHKADLWLNAMHDTSREVQVAGMRFASDGLESGVLIPFLEDNDPWLRLETLRALGKDSGSATAEAVQRYRLNARDPWADIEGARSRFSEADMTSTNPMVRAAAAGHQDALILDRLIQDDAESVVRVAAATAALDRFPSRARALSFLTHPDPMVQVVGAEMLALTGTGRDHTALVDALLLSESEDTVHACLVALHRLSGASVGTLEELKPLATQGSPRIQAALRGPPDPEEMPKKANLEGNVAGSTWMAHVETTRGLFLIELYPQWAPIAVQNFIHLANEGFFDQQVFHRVVPGFVVQTGCPRGDGWGGPGHTIPDEVSRHPYVRGSVGMARAELDSGGSQWFVATSDQPHLAGLYTQFGQVVQGDHVPQRLTVGDRILSVRIQEVLR